MTERFLARVLSAVDEYTGTTLPWVGLGTVAEALKEEPRVTRKALDALTDRGKLRRRMDGRVFQWRTPRSWESL